MELMKKFTLIVALIFGVFSVSFGQIENPVKWEYTARKISDKTYEIHLTAVIDANWHVYAQEAGEGPEPTTIKFTANPLVKREGKVKEIGKLESAYDPNFRSTLRYYAQKVDFVQKVKTKTAANTIVNGTITYMVCNDRKCLPPKEIPFSVKLNGK
jgi:thiol:disulfide interchange protein DsbD